MYDAIGICNTYMNIPAAVNAHYLIPIVYLSVYRIKKFAHTQPPHSR